MKIINLTPHPITLVNSDGSLIQSWAKSETPARCNQTTEGVKTLKGGIIITRTEFGEVYNLPEPKEGVLYIVSRLVLAACPIRTDLLVPNELYRDKDGNIKGCQSFSIN